MKAGNFEAVLKRSMSAVPSAEVDAAIITAIRREAERRRRWHRFVPPMSIAAALAVLLVLFLTARKVRVCFLFGTFFFLRKEKVHRKGVRI